MSFQSIADLEESLRSNCLTVRDLYTVWEQRQPVPDPAKVKKGGGAADPGAARQIAWMQNDVSLVSRFTHCALEKEEFLLVCDCARESLRLWDKMQDQDRTELVRVRMNYAAALARLGYTRRARQELEPCVADDFRPRLGRRLKADIFLQLGHILRQEARYAAARAAQLQTAEAALGFYQRALAVDPERLEALSMASTVAFTTGDADSALRAQACAQAHLVLEKVRDQEDTSGPRFQTTAIRAAAHAVLGDTGAAAASFGELSGLPGAGISELAGARYWSQQLAEGLELDRDYFKPAFPPLLIVVFNGHKADLPGQSPRLPVEALPAARETLRAALDKAHVMVGLCGASAGAELLFIEALRQRGGTVHVVLPWSQREFRRTSVEPYEPPDGQPRFWEPLFDHAIAEAATVREIGQVYRTDGKVGYEYQMEVAAGLALHAARVSRLDVQPMVLWNGQPGRAAGGTDSFVEFWRRRFGMEPVVIRPPALAAEVTTAPVVSGFSRMISSGSLCERDTFRQEVKSMLFADIVGYSKLNESVIPEFVSIFLARLSRLLSESRYAPRHVNTWGDAIYAVFDFANDAGCFALELNDLIQEGREDWLRAGLYWEETLTDGKVLKHPLNIRIGLHTGPVFMHYNPVVRQLGFTGVHVSRAARIEPVATPGEVFASEEFAALSETDAEAVRQQAEAGGVVGFICEYAGSMPLAKDYPGRHRIYRVLPNRAFGIDELAQAIHRAYCAEALERGEKPPGQNGALLPWDELDPNLRRANHAQAADIPNKLHALGYELAPGHGMHASEIPISPETLEAMSVREHDRWAQERQRQGWTYGPVRDNARKHHPLLLPWETLNEVERDKDRATIRNMPWLIEKAGFRVRKLGGTR